MKLFLILLSLLLAALAGCNPRRVNAVGNITVGGTPMAEGTIVFEPIDTAGAPAGGTVHDGHYALLPAARLLPGKNRVLITTTHKTGRTIPAGTPLPRGTMVEEIEPINLPPQEVELALGENKIDFNLP